MSNIDESDNSSNSVRSVFCFLFGWLVGWVVGWLFLLLFCLFVCCCYCCCCVCVCFILHTFSPVTSLKTGGCSVVLNITLDPMGPTQSTGVSSVSCVLC